MCWVEMNVGMELAVEIIHLQCTLKTVVLLGWCSYKLWISKIIILVNIMTDLFHAEYKIWK